MSGQVATQALSKARQAHARRVGFAAGLLGLFVWMWVPVVLTMQRWDGDRLCGSALSNPGWNDAVGCHSKVVGSLWVGLILLVIGAGLLSVAARWVWGDDWAKVRIADGVD